MAYLPYGQERGTPTTPDNREKFATYYRDTTVGADYADQRYYNPTQGRFLSPDRNGIAHLSNPISWNRYVYASDDPVNRLDPTGRDDCGADWMSDASLSGPCYEDGGGSGGGGGGGGDTFVAQRGPEGTGPWATGAMRYANVLLLQALAAAAIKAATSGGSNSPDIYVAYLLLTGDCYEQNNPKTGGVTRDRTYEAIGSDGNPIDATITERVLSTSGGLAGTDSPTSSAVGTFQDQLGLPNNAFNVGSVQEYQYFVTTIPGTSWVNVPTPVQSSSGSNMVFSIVMSHTYNSQNQSVFNTTINGDSGLAGLPKCH